MAETVEKCISCSKIISNDTSSIRIKCPTCDSIGLRCNTCRNKGTAYKCKKCGFEGP